MGTFRFEEARTEDYEALNHIWQVVYYNREPEEPLKNPPPNRKYYVGKTDDQPSCACQVYSYQVFRGEALVSCGGVAGVATLPEFRRSGTASQFMVELLKEMRSQGHAIAALYAFKESYYRRFGYAACGWRWLISAPQHRLAAFAPQLPMRQIQPADVELLNPAYEGFVTRRSGSAKRTKSDWENRLGIKPPLIYAVGDPVEAYCWGHMEGFWNELTLGEIAWSTRRGYETILSVVAGLASNQSKINWIEPPDSPYIPDLLDQGVTCALHRPTMFRVLNVPLALESLRPAGSGEFTFQVVDEQLPENCGPWKVAWADGRVSVANAEGHDFEIDIRAFSQAFMGSPSLDQLNENELISVRNPQGIEEAKKLLTPLAVVCMEFF